MINKNNFLFGVIKFFMYQTKKKYAQNILKCSNLLEIYDLGEAIVNNFRYVKKIH